MDMSQVDLGSEKIENAQQVAMISQIWLKSNPLRDDVFSFVSKLYKTVDLSLSETVCLERAIVQVAGINDLLCCGILFTIFPRCRFKNVLLHHD